MTFLNCRTMLLWWLTIIVAWIASVTAFLPSSPPITPALLQQRHQQQHQQQRHRHTASSFTARFLSDVPKDDDDTNNNNRQLQIDLQLWWKDRIPPPPEDQLTLSGDIAALFVYTFLDHFANQVYQDSVLYDASPDVIHSLDPTGDLSASQLPVWFDAATSFHLTSDKLMSLLGVHHVAYSPILGTPGSASVLLCVCWLAAGYIHQAFAFKNTLDCKTENAVWVTFRTWVTSTLFMVSIALLANYIFCGQQPFEFFCNCPLTTPTLGGLTKADADFIFDSLSVLIVWRFILSSAIGYGK